MRERAAVWLIVLAIVASAAGIGAMPLSQSASGPDTAEIEGDGAGAMDVQNIQLVEQQRSVLRYSIEFSGELDRPYLERSLVRAVDHDRIDASSIRVTEVKSHVATVEVATDGSENPQTVASRMLRAMQLTSQQTQSPTSTTDGGPSANASTGGNGKAKNIEEDETYYQIDFVQGEPIENLQGPEGTYMPDELIRYAHGSTENLLKRSSNGEFTTNESLAACVESSAIVVKSDGTARVSFKIADGCDPVTLSLVSYTKPGPVWSRATESEQEFVDADTRTFAPGGTYTLRVELPPTEGSTTTAATSSESSATERPERNTATETEEATTDSEPDQTSTPTPTTTTMVEVQPQPTPTLTPTPTPETDTSSAATSPNTETPGSSTSEGTAGNQGSSQQTEATDDPPAPSTPEPPATTESDDSDGGSAPTDTPTDDSGDDSPSSSTPTESPTTTDDSNDGGDQTAATTIDPATKEPTTTDDGNDSTSTTTEPPETSTTEPTTTEPPETTETTAETTAEPTTEPPTTTEAPETTTGEPTETSTETTAKPTTEPPTTTETPETTTTTQPTTEEPTTEPPTTTESPETTTTTETDEPTTEPPTTTETTAPTTQPTTTTGTTQPTTTTEGPPEGGSSAEVLFNDQSLEEALRVVAESVTLPTDSNGGFLVAYDAANFGEVDRPDDRIGVSEKLASGTTESVQVDLQFGNASVNERVTMVVVRDSNGNGQYDPGVDTGALNEEGQIASDSAEVSIAVGLLPDPPDDGGDDNGSDGGTNTTTTTTTSDGSGGDNESGDGGGILSSEATDAAESESAEQNASATDSTTTTDPAESTDEEASTPENEGMKTTVTKSPT